MIQKADTFRYVTNTELQVFRESTRQVMFLELRKQVPL